MARKPRLHFPGAVYHVMLRGNAGDPIFFEDGDRYRFYLILQYAVETFRCRIHAFCLMNNHVHLVLQVEDVPLSRVMQNISQRYTKWINRMRSRTGHVFQGRYKALLVDADSYLLELVRYVHLNPVRVGAAADAGDYPWSGQRSYLGKDMLPWLTTGFVLAMLAPQLNRARSAYASYVRDSVGQGQGGEFHRGTSEGRILGDEAFADAVLVKAQQKAGREYPLNEVISAVCAHFQLDEAKLRLPGKVRPMTEARATAAAIVQASPHLRLTDLAKLLDRDIAALGKAAQRVTGDAGLSALADELIAKLRCATSEYPKL